MEDGEMYTIMWIIFFGLIASLVWYIWRFVL